MPARTAIGLDIGTSVVRAAELSFGRGGTTLERFGQVVLPVGAVVDGEVVDEDAVAEAVRQLWKATRFSHKRVSMGVSNQRVIVRQLDLPWMPADELRASLGFHVRDQLPVDIDESVLDFFPLEEVSHEGSRMLRGLLVAAAHSSVTASVRCASKAGLKAVAMDLTPFAVLRSTGRQTSLDVQTEALIDIGARVTNIVVHSAGVPHFVRILLAGGQDVTEAVAERVGVSLAQAEGMKQDAPPPDEESDNVLDDVLTQAIDDFTDEIRGSLDYYGAANSQAPVDRIVLSGGGSKLEGLVERLTSITRVPVVEGDPLAMLRIGRTGLDDDQLDFIKPLAAVPVGLALGVSR